MLNSNAKIHDISSDPLTSDAASENLETVFLSHICRQKVPLTVFLVNGVKLQGSITDIDDATVLLSRDGHDQLVYRHAISTIMPVDPVVFANA